MSAGSAPSPDVSRLVLPLPCCAGAETAVVGGKATGLGALFAAGLPVPPGFVVTTHAYRAALADLRPAIAEQLAAPGSAEANAKAVRDLIETVALPAAVADPIRAAYAELGAGPVAVRSSATAEDAEAASFAGQQDTHLWVDGAEEVLRHVVACWASLFNAHAIAYRRRVGADSVDVAMAVVVQRMVDADAAGVALTLDPATGDRGTAYLEAALGLGEGVVRGDVPVDRLWITKADGSVRAQHAVKDRAHRYDPVDGRVAIRPVPLGEAADPALTGGQVIALADLIGQVEAAFGRPMDIEWAVADDDVWLLQARPETVHSQREPLPPPGSAQDWDPLHHVSPPGAHWTTVNLGETAPGVLTPLAWTLWGSAGESAIRRAGHNLGVLDDDEVRLPDREADRLVKSFYGRAAMQVEFLATLGDRMPGTSGAEAVRSILGEPPGTMTFSPSKHRWPAIARKLPQVFLRTPAELQREAARTHAWWQRSVDRVSTLDRPAATALFVEAATNFETMLALQTTALLGVVQPLYQALERLAARTGVGDVSTLSSGYSGFQEVAVVGELWRAAHGQTTIAAIAREHGFHGPLEGEVSSRVWRERPELLAGLLDEYRQREDPRANEARLRANRERMERDLVAALPRPARPATRRLLRLCAARIPLRGVAKRSFLQSIDVARAAARRIGELLVAEGVLVEADDVFYLTAEELTGTLPADTAALVTRRRERRARYRELSVPPSWRGDCVPGTPSSSVPGAGAITGIGVSAGVVEGIVRVLESSDSTGFVPDEVLVAPTTDPSWSSIMFVSAALVVDIGGALSHASMVARELGIPAVVNTGDGTRRLRTGDRVRVDGTRGIVELLDRKDA
jgi:pyruvate,water dikinase